MQLLGSQKATNSPPRSRFYAGVASSLDISPVPKLTSTAGQLDGCGLRFVAEPLGTGWPGERAIIVAVGVAWQITLPLSLAFKSVRDAKLPEATTVTM
jgi:hypothetical protein